MVLGRDAILSAHDLGHRDIEVPEWGGVVRIKQWSGKERLRLAEAGADLPDEHAHALVVALGVVDDQGALLFRVEDVDALMERNQDVLVRVAREVLAFNGLGQEDAGKD